ncbi:BTAD domain-containing putative transcriptional regulator [Streptomyces kanamyceticus]|uniref:BTAD domain-containing putative transcriptional regulator n=1 Tax=Streptomyces kanamyceticus TaxID=1967 RepID=UPI0006E1AB1C|nr:BTAD domain-containing putative transcriptional regulator [Streptomyces kanamyceticus]
MKPTSLEPRADVPEPTGPPPIGALGSLSVRGEGRPLELGPPRQRAVLALLLIGAGGVVSVDSIVSRIWGDAPPATANATLQSYVSRLRKLLADCVLPDGSRPRLHYQQPGYALVIDPEHVDVHRFEGAVRAGSRLAQKGSVDEAHAVLSAALDTWAGAPYEELSAYDFAVQEAARLEQLRLSAVESWAQCALRLGREENVLHPLAIEAKRNPLRERLTGLYMHAQYRLGRQADALRTYEETRHALAEEIGADPGRELAALHAAILRQDCSLERAPEVAVRGARDDTRCGPAPAVEEPPHPTPAVESGRITIPAPRSHTGRHRDAGARRRAAGAPPVFVGRDDELRALVDSATGAFHTSGRVAFLVGEAGIGKTRLVSELARTVPEGVHTVWASCSESEDKPDYWPWTTLLRRLTALWPDRVRRLPDWVRQGLAHLLPEICSDGCEPPFPGPSARPVTTPLSRDARFTLHDAVCQALLRTVREPTVLVVEDVDRADAPSLALLRLFVEQLRSVPILLVVTTRTFQLAHDAELRRAAAVILQSLDARRILLKPLDLAATEALACGTLGESPEPRLLERLHLRTAGNPFFLGYLLHAGQQGLAVDPDAVIPHELAGVVLERLSGLPPGIRRLLELCAVMEDGCEQRVVEAMLRHEGISADTVPLALHGGLLAPDPVGHDRLRFVHPLVREAVRHALENTRTTSPAGAA